MKILEYNTFNIVLYVEKDGLISRGIYMGNGLSDIGVNYITEYQWTFHDGLPPSLSHLQNNQSQNKNNTLLASHRLIFALFCYYF